MEGRRRKIGPSPEEICLNADLASSKYSATCFLPRFFSLSLKKRVLVNINLLLLEALCRKRWVKGIRLYFPEYLFSPLHTVFENFVNINCQRALLNIVHAHSTQDKCTTTTAYNGCSSLWNFLCHTMFWLCSACIWPFTQVLFHGRSMQNVECVHNNVFS